MIPYVYRGAEPWTPKPKPEPTDATPHALDPCGTRGAYRRHLNADEEPCTPCIEANRAYYRQWRATWTPTPEQAATKRERGRQYHARKRKEAA